MKIPYGDLRVLVNNAVAFTSGDDTLPALTCVQWAAENGRLVTRSTDRYKLLRQTYIPPVEKVATQPGVTLPEPPVEVWPPVLVTAGELKQLLANLKKDLASVPVRTRHHSKLDVGPDGDYLVVGGFKVDLFRDGAFPQIDRLLEGHPLQHDQDFAGVIALGPQHLAALDRLRLHNDDKRSPDIKFGIATARKAVYMTPVVQRDELTIEALLMPVTVIS